MTEDKLFGLVLTGGRSTRMGTDKSVLHYHGKPQREYLFELLSRYCESVYTSCKSDQHVPAELHPLEDALNISSPINGILSAFQKHPHHSWLAIAVDMPYVDAEAVTYLIRHRKKNKAATCFLNPEEHFPEPLFTIWEAHAYPVLQDFVASGEISPRKFLSLADVQTLHAQNPNVLVNINSKRDFENFEL